MRQIPAWLWWLIAGCAFAIFALAALLYGNDWWLSGIVTVSLFAWLGGVLAAIYGRPEGRAAITGAVATGFLYMLLAQGPWFREHVGPWLLTTRGLVFLETVGLGRTAQPQQTGVYQTISPYTSTLTGMPGGGWGYSGGGTVMLQPQVWTTQVTPIVITDPNTGTPTAFQTIGHWLCGWMCAFAGMLVAIWISRPPRSKTASVETARAENTGESPFAEVAP